MSLKLKTMLRKRNKYSYNITPSHEMHTDEYYMYTILEI